MNLCGKTIGLIAIGAGVFLLMAAFLPAIWLVFMQALLLVVIGVLCLFCR